MSAADITVITVDTYHQDPEHRRLADRLLAANRLDPHVVRRLTRKPDGTWLAKCFKRDEAGLPYVDPDTDDVAYEWIHLPNQVQP